MSEVDNIDEIPSDTENSAFKAIVSQEKLPLRIRDEVVGTMEIITLFGNIVQLFSSNFGNAVVAMLSDSRLDEDEDDNDQMNMLASKPPIPLNDNTSSLI